MLRKGIIGRRGVLSGRPKKKFVDTGAVKRVAGKRPEEVSVHNVPVQECETTPEEDKKFIEERKEELLQNNPEVLYEMKSDVEKFKEDREAFAAIANCDPHDLFCVTGGGAGIDDLRPSPTREIEPKVSSEYYVVIDFEATCSKSERFSREETEIIEFAAVLVDKGTLLPVDEFDMFVRPVLHPQLDNFCTELTSITQADVDGGFSFPTVLRQFTNWLDQHSGAKTFCSWGEYDKNQLRMECERNGIAYPFEDDHINIKKLFSRKRGYKKGYGVGAALKSLKMDFEGTQHRGIDDARNIARLLKHTATELS